MENKPEIPKSDIEKLKDISKIARARIEKEFAETANSWPACVGSIAAYYSIFLQTHDLETKIEADKYEDLSSRIEALQSKVDELRQMYPKREDTVPEETKEEIYRTIETITEGI